MCGYFFYSATWAAIDGLQKKLMYLIPVIKRSLNQYFNFILLWAAEDFDVYGFQKYNYTL